MKKQTIKLMVATLIATAALTGCKQEQKPAEAAGDNKAKTEFVMPKNLGENAQNDAKTACDAIVAAAQAGSVEQYSQSVKALADAYKDKPFEEQKEMVEAYNKAYLEMAKADKDAVNKLDPKAVLSSEGGKQWMQFCIDVATKAQQENQQTAAKK